MFFNLTGALAVRPIAGRTLTGSRGRRRASAGRKDRRAALSTLIESLERRTHLTASPIFSGFSEADVVSLTWQGRQVEAIRDSWMVRMPQTNAATARNVADYQSARPHVPSGWTIRDLGLGFFNISAPGQSEAAFNMWASQVGAGLQQPNLVHRKLAEIPNEGPVNPPTNPGFGSLWGLQNTGQVGALDSSPTTNVTGTGTPGSDIDVTRVWAGGVTGSQDIIIAVMDDGIDYTHADLQANMWSRPANVPASRYGLHGWDSADDDDDIAPVLSTHPVAGPLGAHGTHVAGTIGARGDNGRGISGVMQEVQLYGAKVFGDRLPNASSADIVDAINRIVELRVTYGQNIVAINASLGGVGPENLAETSAIATAGSAGILFVAAAGNGGGDRIGDNNDVIPVFPANTPVPNVIAVAASNRRDELTVFSNWGQSVHIAAPGSGIWSTVPGNAYDEYPGTSMAAPHVAGVAGLIASAYYAQTGELPTVEMMRSAILDGADVIPTTAGASGLTNTTTSGVVAGNRRLNAYGAIQQLPVIVSVSDTEVTEGDAGQATVQVTVSLSRALSQPVTVAYTTRDGTALAADGDYVAATGSLTFGAGQTSGTISLVVNGDDWFERDEYFEVVISAVSGAPVQSVPGRFTIANDDPEVMRIDVLPALAMKRTGPTVAEFILRPYMPVREPIRISYTTADGTAKAGRDYRPNNGFIELRPGQTEKRLEVSILGNRRQDRDKTFTLAFQIQSGPDALLYNPADGSRDPERLVVPGLIVDTNSRLFSLIPDSRTDNGRFGFTVQVDRPRQFGDAAPVIPGLDNLPTEVLEEVARRMRFTTHYLIGHQSVGRILRKPPAHSDAVFSAGVVELGYFLDENTGRLVMRTSERIEVPVQADTSARPTAVELVSPTNAQIKPREGKVTLRSLALGMTPADDATPLRRIRPGAWRSLR